MEWFSFPSIIFYFIIPLISLVILWYKLLQEKLRIFRRSGINFGIAIIISFFSSFIIRLFGPGWVTAVGVGGTILVMGRLTFIRMILTFVTAIIVSYFYGIVLSTFA